jgi:hypothetical protein
VSTEFFAKHANSTEYYCCCSKADACDVINFNEYEDVVNKILEKKPTRAITIFVDMKDVEKSIKVCVL